MPVSLDDLMKIEGVVAATEFTLDGRLVDFRSKMNITAEMAATCADLCAPVNIMFETLSQELMRFSDMNWAPQRGWAFSGGEWTIAVGGMKGVAVKTTKADFNELFRVLVGDREDGGEAHAPEQDREDG
jgi:roadblock/LC7 domain-containing protein